MATAASLPGSAIRQEDTLGFAALLAACGGFLDAFTYLGHGHVFANAMSGNVVLLGVFAATGNWTQSYSHLQPILAFLLGVGVAQAFHLPRFLEWIPEARIASLTLEILFLLAGGCFPKEFAGTLLVLGISFVAALQNSTFRKTGTWNYSSTMTTGNLRIFGEAMLQAALGPRDSNASEKAKVFAVICAAFLCGAVFGGICTVAIDNHALWIVDVMLMALWFRLFAAFRMGRAGASVHGHSAQEPQVVQDLPGAGNDRS